MLQFSAFSCGVCLWGSHARRNSRAQQRERRKSIRLLGNVVELDEWLDWRVKWGQRGASLFAIMSSLAFILNSILFESQSILISVSFAVAATGFLTSMVVMIYKNFSFLIARRVLKEVNVVMMLVLAMSIVIIDSVRPYNSFSPINASIYFCMITLWVFIDAVTKKSRVFVLIVGFFFSLASFYLVYEHTYEDTAIGVIIFQYGDAYVFRKRAVKRSCFLQIFLFSINGLWIMINDKKMEMIMFATGNIYRETGTASKYVEDRDHSERMRSETAESMV